MPSKGNLSKLFVKFDFHNNSLIFLKLMPWWGAPAYCWIIGLNDIIRADENLYHPF
jgi:hypothetical protein